jgi:putative SOS response-associated peptidase YedK
MCGRFTLSLDPADLAAAFPEFNFPQKLAPRYNIAPTQPVLALPNDGSRRADFFLWGLIPSWAKDPSIGSRLINARAETLAEKPSFRAAFKYRRCLIFADGFYEWQPLPGQKAKQPYFIRLKSGRPFAFAGLWELWNSPDGGQLPSCTIITTTPNELMAGLHNRMPVILRPDDYAQWLDPAPLPTRSLLPLLQPYPAEEMTAHPVSPLVNNPANDRPECTQPT